MIPRFNSDSRFAAVQLQKAVTRLHDNGFKPPVDARVHQADSLIEAYVTATGMRPDSYSLQRLADYILVDDMTDQYKWTREREMEYPFLTDRQTKRRHDRSVPYYEGSNGLEVEA